MKHFQTDRLNLAFTDKTLNEKPRFTLRNTSITLANLNGPKSSMFGEGADLSTIEFPQGTTTLISSEEKKLNALAKALADRPALKMELKGYVDREKDAEGYRSNIQSLAQERSATVMAYLVKQGGIAAGRIFLKKDDIYKTPEKSTQSRSRVELNAIAP